MKTYLICLAWLTYLTVLPSALTQGTAFTYQGRLTDAGNPSNGDYDLRLILFDVEEFGFPIGAILTNDVTVVNGLFVTQLDFGAGAFDGTARWLEIGVRTNGSVAAFVALIPRQPLRPAPQSLFALNAGLALTANTTAWNGLTGVPAGFLDGIDNDTAYSAGTGLTLSGTQFSVSFGGSGVSSAASRSDHTHSALQIISGTLPDARLAGTYSSLLDFTNDRNSFAGVFAGDGRNLTALSASELRAGTVPDARLAGNLARTNQVWLLGGNNATTSGTHFLGTTDDEPLEFKINGTRALRLENNRDSVDLNSSPDGAPNIIAGSHLNFVAPSVVGATISGGGATNYFDSAWTNVILGDYGTVSGGLGHRISTNAFAAAIGGGWANTILTFSGGSTIGGGRDNVIADGTGYGTIAGGRLNDIGSRSEASAIGGGLQNVIGTNSHYSSIGGGRQNAIADNAERSSIAGGELNTISTNSHHSVIGGGERNVIATSSFHSTIGGGSNNIVAFGSQFATIPGGNNNTATDFAFAAGRRAKANHQGAFVWADSSNTDIASADNNSVTMRASGGYRLFSNSGSTLGVTVAPNGGSWTSISDRNAKENFEPVNTRALLDKVAALPLSTWNYKGQTNTVRHIGPMAQDFKAAFAVGEDDTGITTVDADGVALAAIQGLHQLVKEKDAKISALEQRLANLEQLLFSIRSSKTE